MKTLIPCCCRKSCGCCCSPVVCAEHAVVLAIDEINATDSACLLLRVMVWLMLVWAQKVSAAKVDLLAIFAMVCRTRARKCMGVLSCGSLPPQLLNPLKVVEKKKATLRCLGVKKAWAHKGPMLPWESGMYLAAFLWHDVGPTLNSAGARCYSSLQRQEQASKGFH